MATTTMPAPSAAAVPASAEADRVTVLTEWIEDIADVRLPPSINDRMQILMGRNNEGDITASEFAELESLADFSEALSLARLRALSILGRSPAE